MFKNNKEVKDSTLDEMKAKAMEAQDYETVRKLNDIESEMQSKLFKERMKGMFDGYSSAVAGFIIGAIIVSMINSRKSS
jgi:formate dehydrogenase maturation protein FdhE